MSDTCLTCGHLIPAPNVVMGYSGPICHCTPTPRIQRPASLEQRPEVWTGALKTDQTKAIDELTRQNKILREQRNDAVYKSHLSLAAKNIIKELDEALKSCGGVES